MGWEPSAHTDMVQKGFKHGKTLDLKAFFCFFSNTHCFYVHICFPHWTAAVISQGYRHAYAENPSPYFSCAMSSFSPFFLLCVPLWIQYHGFNRIQRLSETFYLQLRLSYAR